MNQEINKEVALTMGNLVIEGIAARAQITELTRQLKEAHDEIAKLKSSGGLKVVT